MSAGSSISSYLRGAMAAQQLFAQMQQMQAQRQQLAMQQAQAQREAELFPAQKRQAEAAAKFAELRPDLEAQKALTFELPTDVPDEKLASLPPALQISLRHARAKGEKSIKLPSSLFGQINTASARSEDLADKLKGQASEGDKNRASREKIAAEGRESQEKIARERIRVADERTAILERNASLPKGSLRPVMDGDGNLTGEFINTRTGEVLENDQAQGLRLTAEPDAVKQRRKQLAITKNMVGNIRKAALGLADGEDIVNNLTLLQAQMATFGQIAKGLGGETGVLTEQDVGRVSASVPGVIESGLARYSSEARGRILTKIKNLEDILAKVEAASEPTNKKKSAASEQETHVFNPQTGRIEPVRKP